MERDGLERVLLRARGLAVLRGVLESPAAQYMLELLGILARVRPESAAVARTFGRLWEELALEPYRLLPDAWQSHLVGRLLDDENAFSLASEMDGMNATLAEQVRRDLRTLGGLFRLDGETVLGMVEEAVAGARGIWVPWSDPGVAGEESPRHEVARRLAAEEDWGRCLELVSGYHARHGAGPFGRYRAFRWTGDGLKPVAHPDPVRLADLVGYEREREPLVLNTERFLRGLPAHHALLYGLPGTGKSSTVKAIAREYGDRGLRLVEIAKEDLGDLPEVLELLRGRAPRFVLFVDDLSFEEHEVEYKALKALLEGSVEEPPENVRVYATSNRRNLVRESFADRGDGIAGDDVHARDTMHEKLSLAARFGLRVTFPTPDQKQYLEIVAGLAGRRGIELPEEELVERALLWERWHSGRSGRTARQFVDELEAELSEG
ncbi:MAG: ATP-binding protein [Actinomycetota bacterium]